MHFGYKHSVTWRVGDTLLWQLMRHRPFVLSLSQSQISFVKFGSFFGVCFPCKIAMGRQNKFKCDKCQYETAWSATLHRHKKSVHEKLRDYQCKQCEFATSRKSGLIRHINSIHEKLKPHHCPKCEYATSNKNHLQGHISDHTSVIDVHMKLITNISCKIT